MIDKHLGKQLFSEIVHSFYADGTLTESDLKLPTREFLDKFLSIVKKTDLKPIVDYRETILSQAEEFLRQKQFEYATVFFAMFFEHTLNGIIHTECKRRHIEEKDQSTIIRSVDLYGKLTWLPLLLGHKKFNEKHLKTIKLLADKRNAFVHYKWKMEVEDEVVEDLKIQEQFKQVKAAVKYIRLYESNFFYLKNKKNIASKINIKKPESKLSSKA